MSIEVIDYLIVPVTGKLRQIIDQLEIENEYFYQKIRTFAIHLFLNISKKVNALTMNTFMCD